MKKAKYIITSLIVVIFSVVFIGLISYRINNIYSQETNSITLYTAGGTISDTNYNAIKAGSTYTSKTLPSSVDELPTPSIKGDDENVKFVGWYSDISLKNLASSITANSKYYARWSRTTTTVKGDFMAYQIDGNVDAFGYKEKTSKRVFRFVNNNYLQTTYNYGGFASY